MHRLSRSWRGVGTALAVAGAVLLTSAGAHADDGEVVDAATIRTLIVELGETVSALRENGVNQVDAWPNREREQANEQPPPLAVRRLQEEQAVLTKRRDVVVVRIERELVKGEDVIFRERRGDADVSELLAAIATTEDQDLVVALVPIVVKLGRKHPKAPETIARAAVRFDPTPAVLVEALADLGHPQASLFLVELGRRERSMGTLAAAARGGHPEAVGKIIAFAEGTDSELADVAIRAIGRVGPPMESANRELGELVMDRIGKAKSNELRVALLGYLGLFRSPDYYDFLSSVFASSKDTNVQIAALAALGNTGEEAAGFLLDLLRDERRPFAIRRACVHSLGGMKCRQAIEPLIAIVDDGELGRDVARALRRISGKDFGRKKGHWVRWWRAEKQRAAQRKA